MQTRCERGICERCKETKTITKEQLKEEMYGIVKQYTGGNNLINSVNEVMKGVDQYLEHLQQEVNGWRTLFKESIDDSEKLMDSSDAKIKELEEKLLNKNKK